VDSLKKGKGLLKPSSMGQTKNRKKQKKTKRRKRARFLSIWKGLGGEAI